MVPEAEGLIPKEQEAERPLKVEEISPVTLSQFIRSQEADLEIPYLGSDYRYIFEALRTLSPTRQEELLIDFFAQRVENFPNA